ncbi:MAG: glycosyltransferase family 2 protein [Nitrospirae bacterium]|nr:glycosyltransferase family 2 protein [Nitrospirota bacterium]
MIRVIFFSSLFLILYTYILYPLFLLLLASLVQSMRDIRYLWNRTDRRKRVDHGNFPFISIIVAAYNEEGVIEQKILNCMGLDYPKDRMEIIIASDCSTDRTNSIVAGYANMGINLIAFAERRGKTSVLNSVIPKASGSIVVLSDANTMYERNSLINLVRHFSDPKIGGVCGELRLRPHVNGADEESYYWRFENTIKFLENRIGATLGANGGVYAIRKEAFQPIPADTIIDDFIIFLKVRERGYTTIFDPEAIAYEETAPDLTGEYKRRIRIGAGNFQSISMARGFLSPFRGTVAFSFWSHKVLRWCMPFSLVALFFTNLLLLREDVGYLLFFILQTGVYILAVIGYYKRNNILFKGAYYFLSMNIALLKGFLRFLKGSQKAAWERTQR